MKLYSIALLAHILSNYDSVSAVTLQHKAGFVDDIVKALAEADKAEEENEKKNTKVAVETPAAVKEKTT